MRQRRAVRAVRRRLGRVARRLGLRRTTRHVLAPPPPDIGQVAVVIPAHNESRFLGQTLESLQAQTYQFWRAIVVDDQSSDETTSIVAGFATRDPRISGVRLRRNAGLPAARNAGLAQVQEPFVLFLDGDDALFPDALETRVRLLTEDVAAAGVYGKTRQVPADSNWRHEAGARRKGASTQRITLVSANGENPFGIHEVLLRTESARTLGGFEESIRNGGEDVDFWARALRSGMEFAGTGRTDSIYRQTPTSMVSAGAVDHMRSVVGLLDTAWRGQGSFAERTGRPGIAGDLGDVLRRGMVENRLFRYLGMVGYSGDSASLDTVRAELMAKVPLCHSRESARTFVLQGLTRSAKRAGVDDLDDLPERADQLLSTVADAFPAVGSELTPRRDHPSWAVLVENRAHARLVTTALASTPPQSWPVFLVGDTVDADMGALAFLSASHPDAVTRSLPKLLLDSVAYDLVVLPEPLSWLGREIAREAHARGGSLRLLELPFSDAVTIDDEDSQATGPGPFELAAEKTTLDELGVIAAGRTRQDQPRRAATTRTLSWPGTVSREGSLGDYRGLARPSLERLAELKDSRKGERAVIIGNGPSLNKTDLDLLKGVPTFGVNGIYYADQRLPEPLTYYVVEDTAVFRENTPDVLAYGRTAETFLLPTLYAPSCGPDDDPVFFRMNGGFYKAEDPNYCRPRFSTNAAEVLYCGQSVTIINLQLAYWMGYSEIALIGMDFSYAVPAGTAIKGNLYTSAGDDPNHFDSRYFGAGKTWKDPKLNRVLANYALAKAVYESDGRRIVNCTVGGALEAFDRVDLADFALG
jgi:glycosyltransferase involved in cell wall biosynthesis